MPAFALIAPLLAMSIASGTLTPIPLASISHAGSPVSASWRISSALTLPLAFICPRARVIRSIPSCPSPTAIAASPTVRMIGITASTWKPYAWSFLEASSKPGSSKGVVAAKLSNCAICSFAFSALPVSTSNALVVISAFIFTEAMPRAAAAAAIHLNLLPTFSDSFMLSVPKASFILRFTAANSLLSPLLFADIVTSKSAIFTTPPPS